MQDDDSPVIRRNEIVDHKVLELYNYITETIKP